jgi:hypothetical protein
MVEDLLQVCNTISPQRLLISEQYPAADKLATRLSGLQLPQSRHQTREQLRYHLGPYAKIDASHLTWKL